MSVKSSAKRAFGIITIPRVHFMFYYAGRLPVKGYGTMVVETGGGSSAYCYLKLLPQSAQITEL